MSEIGITAGLVIENLSRNFETAAGVLSILKDVKLSLQTNEAIAITGPSGSGKSTLLYIIGTLDEPTSGSVSILGENPFTLSAKQLAAFRNKNIGFIFQDHHLLPQCTVLENVLIPTLTGEGTPNSGDRALELLNRVGLTERTHHRPTQLSGGERQRVAICRALINQPAVLLADEPTGNLDQDTAESVGNLLLELNAEQQIILICVTHSLALAKQFPKHFALADGQLHTVSE